jgi:DNA-binding SARP family transcriptional activator/Tfp pilus assembly protein PilF
VLVGTQFQLLGAVEARVDGRVLEAGHLRQWCVLAVLLLDANRPVPVDALVDRVWGDRAPQRARDTLYGYLSRLRGALAPAGDARITRRASGYLLTVDPDAVDVHRFHRLVASAREIRDCEAALGALEEALGLWRGAALPLLDTPWLNSSRTALDRARLGAELERNDLALRCGRHARVLDEMSAAVETYPLDERLAGQLMLGLYRAGRQGEALDYYRRLRSRLADDVGVDPGAALRLLHRRILQADPTLTTAGSPDVRSAAPPRTDPVAGNVRPVADAVPVGPRVPRQVPAPPRTFTGRTAELAQLSELTGVSDGPELSARCTVCAIVGPGGVGKTWIARRWAHEHLSRYPDGQLFADLRGFDPAGSPVPASVVVRGFLDALGVAAEAIPADLDAQTALYRSLAADKRLLIVLDNARDSTHAAPLLPGAAGCTVLVTSRHRLVGLVNAHGARPLALGTLAGDEARRLLAGHLGNRRVAAEPAAVDTLLRHCSGLPLALGIVASRAAVHPGLPLAELAAELEDVTTRLDALDGGELAVNVRAALSCSTDSLSQPAARLFALLGFVVGADAGLAAVASLAGLPVAATRGLLRRLTAAHLVAEPRPGRWHMHDLVRLYAAEQSGMLGDRSTARRRMLDHYLQTGYAANRVLSPLRDAIEPAPPAPGVGLAPVSDEAQAKAWFAAEHANLLAAVSLAADEGLDTHAWQLAWTMATYLDRYAHWRDQAAVHTVASAAARRLGDRTAQAYALCGLARAQIWLGRYEEARGHLRSALDLLGDASEPAWRAHVHRAFARSYARGGEPRRALAHDEQALALYRAAGHRCGQATALNAIGWHRAHLGEVEQALPFCAQALTLHRQNGDRQGVAATLDSLGYIHRRLGRHDEAIRCYQQAIQLYGELGDRYEIADTLANLGDTYAAADDPDPARMVWQRAIVMLDELGVPTGPLRSKLVPAQFAL